MARRSSRAREVEISSADSQMQVVIADDESAIVGLKHARDGEEYEDKDEEDKEKLFIKGRKRAKNAPSSKSKTGAANEDDQSAESSSGKKKQRMPEQFRKVRGKFGVLETLAKDVPLDVIFEIFCYLDPGDLLRLARTSKDLRGILMSKSSERIWRTAREGVEGLPPRPEDLNEPQYAHLLYEPSCHICNSKTHCDTVLWSFRVRCCKKCASATFPLCCHPDYRGNQPSEYRYLDILPWENVKVNSRRYRNTQRVGNNEIAARFKAEFEAFRPQKSHGHLYDEWHRSKLAERTGQLEDIRAQRRQDILERLEELGWREEAENMMATQTWVRNTKTDEFTEHKLVKQSKKLTDLGWNKIKDEMVQMLSDRKTDRLAKQRSRTLSLRYSRLGKEYRDLLSKSDLREPFPGQGDILMNPLFENLIRDTPIEEDLTEEFFRSKLSEHLPRIIDEWRPAKTQEIVDIMRKAAPTAIASDPALAANVFRCTNCTDTMQYPQMFYHSCCFKNWTPNRERMWTYDIEYSGLSNGPWNSYCITWSGEDSRIARTLIEASSLDPATTTTRDINAANPLIECTACDNSRDSNFGGGWGLGAGRFFMKWPDALVHSTRGHSEQLIVSSESLPRDSVVASESQSTRNTICCAYCNKLLSFWNLAPHLKDHHKDTFDSDKLEVPSTNKQKLMKHCYWNPCCSMNELMSGGFRYKAT